MPQLQPAGKPKSRSLTIQGAVLSAAAVVVAFLLRLVFDLDVQAEEITEIIAGAVALVGSLLAIIGRVRATETVA